MRIKWSQTYEGAGGGGGGGGDRSTDSAGILVIPSSLLKCFKMVINLSKTCKIAFF